MGAGQGALGASGHTQPLAGTPSRAPDPVLSSSSAHLDYSPTGRICRQQHFRHSAAAPRAVRWAGRRARDLEGLSPSHPTAAVPHTATETRHGRGTGPQHTLLCSGWLQVARRPRAAGASALRSPPGTQRQSHRANRAPAPRGKLSPSPGSLGSGPVGGDEGHTQSCVGSAQGMSGQCISSNARVAQSPDSSVGHRPLLYPSPLADQLLALFPAGDGGIEMTNSEVLCSTLPG